MVPLRHLQGLLQTVAEQAAVGQIGQRIEMRQTENTRLIGLAFADVTPDAKHADQFVILIQERCSIRSIPAPGTIDMVGAIFNTALPGTLLKDPLEKRAESGQIVRVQQIGKTAAKPSFRVAAEHGLASRRNILKAALHVQGVDGVASRFNKAAEFLLATVQAVVAALQRLVGAGQFPRAFLDHAAQHQRLLEDCVTQ